MPVPSLDFEDFALQEIPEFHRTPSFIAWMQAFANGGISWLNDKFWKYCFGNESVSVYSSIITYNINNEVKTYYGVYVSLVDNNIANDPQNSPDFWYKISPSYIGALERSSYNSQKLIMEFALNRWFFTNFKQPTSLEDGTVSSPYGVWYLPKSDIFITTTEITFFSPDIFDIPKTTKIYDIPFVASTIFDTSVSSTDTTYKYTIWIPVSLSVSLGLNYIQIISQVVNKIGLLGTVFDIQTY